MPEGTRTIDIVDVSRLLLDETLMDAAFVDDDPRLGGHRPGRLPVGSALAMTTADGADVLALVPPLRAPECITMTAKCLPSVQSRADLFACRYPSGNADRQVV